MATEQDETTWVYAQTQVSMVDFAQSSGLPPELLRELVEYGALAPVNPQAGEWTFSGDSLVRVRTAARLRNDLELDTPVLALVLSFLERIDRLEAEMRRLSAQLVAPPRDRR